MRSSLGEGPREGLGVLRSRLRDGRDGEGDGGEHVGGNGRTVFQQGKCVLAEEVNDRKNCYISISSPGGETIRLSYSPFSPPPSLFISIFFSINRI